MQSPCIDYISLAMIARNSGKRRDEACDLT